MIVNSLKRFVHSFNPYQSVLAKDITLSETEFFCLMVDIPQRNFDTYYKCDETYKCNDFKCECSCLNLNSYLYISRSRFCTLFWHQSSSSSVARALIPSTKSRKHLSSNVIDKRLAEVLKEIGVIPRTHNVALKKRLMKSYNKTTSQFSFRRLRRISSPEFMKCSLY